MSLVAISSSFLSKAQTALCALSAGLLLVGLAAAAQAQPSAGPCEASPAVGRALEALSDDGAQMTSAARKEKQLAALRSLLRQYPDDLFVHQRYQDVARGGVDADPRGLIEQYRLLSSERPNDPLYLYLYGRLLIGRKTPEARAQMERALAQDPDFPWPHLALASIYGVPRYKDKAKALAGVRAFMRLCPSTLNSEAYRHLWSADDPALLRESARRLRARLESGADAKELPFYDTLWQLEFRARPVAEHAQVRRQVGADLQRLRGMNLTRDQKWLNALRAGYKITGDKEGMRWAEDQIINGFPQSELAKRIVMGRWEAENPYPDGGGPEEKIQAYYAKLMQATQEWARRWPDDALIRNRRFDAVSELKEAPLSEVEAAADALLQAIKKDPDQFYSSPPTPILLSQVYLRRSTRLDRIPELVRRGFKEVEERSARATEYDWNPPGERDYAQEELQYTYWTGWRILVETFVRTNQLAKAREVLREMEAALAKQRPGDKATAEERLTHNMREAGYWGEMGRLAEAERHKLDALAYYQNALTLRPPRGKKPATEEPDELALKAERLWKELGGTSAGWANWSRRGDSAKAVAEAGGGLWEKKDKVLPDFELADMQGRTWRLADLKGKVAFINIWATWCGPCREELPYVQKLYERMKGRPDVLVLTLNIDQELGLVEPYLKERKLTFPVLLPAFSYVESMLPSISIPRNWVVDAQGTLQMEQRGFGREGDEWLQKALEMIQKAGAAK